MDMDRQFIRDALEFLNTITGIFTRNLWFYLLENRHSMPEKTIILYKNFSFKYQYASFIPRPILFFGKNHSASVSLTFYD